MNQVSRVSKLKISTIDESAVQIIWHEGGFWLAHLDKDLCLCSCWVATQEHGDEGEGVWNLWQTRGTISLDPSIECPECGLHGYIKNSKWLPV